MSTDERDASELYAGREQTLVKHFILDKYLERFAHIIGMFWDTITYVDCFSGPWNVKSDQLEDSSFSIAMTQLRKAKADLAKHDKSLSLRCFFLEKEAKPYQRLKQFADSTTDAEVKTRNAALEDSIDEICEFVKQGGPSFPFIFVDPTGWAGFSMNLIAPLLDFKPGEVLVNFMTGHILRFAEHPDPGVEGSFDRLFGPIDYRRRIANLGGQDREDELVRCYMDAIRATGKFDYVCSALVLHPEKDRTHFHLIYATRNLRGVEVFKQVEKKAMKVMETERRDAQKRRRFETTGQAELPFANDVMYSGNHYENLRNRYLRTAHDHVEKLLAERKRLLFDDAWAEAMKFQLVWPSDLKVWITEWKKTGRIRLEGLAQRDRVPKLGKEHWLVLVDEPSGDNTLHTTLP